MLLTFLLFAVLLLLAAVSIVATPLLRGNAGSGKIVRQAANLAIARDQLAEMETDLRMGLLTQEAFEAGKLELQSRLLEESKFESGSELPESGRRYRIAALLLIAVIPLFSALVYYRVGNWQAIVIAGSSGHADFNPVYTEADLESLERQVDSKPDDPAILYKLARSYVELEKFDGAVAAYDRLTKMVPGEAQLWADYADALAVASGGRLSGRPEALLEKALSLDPDNMKALALSGTAAMERKNYSVVIRQWEHLLSLIPPDNPNAKVIDSGIKKARSLMKGTSSVISGNMAGTEKGKIAKTGINGVVALDPVLRSRVTPDDIVFILARAADGPRMPLAILKKKVSDLPFTFDMDDTMAMSPDMKLSNYDKLIVVAKVSKSGNAVSQSGDLQGMSRVIHAGSRNVNVTIDTVIP